MDKFIDEIEKILVTLVPFILFSGMPPYLMPLALCIPLLLKKGVRFIEYLFTKHNYKLTIYEYPNNRLYCGMTKNKFFNIMAFIVKKHNLIGNIKKTVSYESSHPSGMKENVIMTILPDNNSKFTFQHKDFIVEIESSQHVSGEKEDFVNKCFIITSKSEKNLTLFKQYLYDTRKEYFSSLNTIRYTHMLFLKREKEWIPKNINVTKTFDNVFFDIKIKDEIKNNISNFYKNQILYDKFGIPKKLGLIFYGIPGTGKSSTIYAIANTFDMNIYPINLNCTSETFIDQIREVKEKSIVLFEDIDTIDIACSRNVNEKEIDPDKKKESKKEDLLLGTLLEVLDGYRYLNNCIIIMTTNHYDKLDSALIRPGRIDHHYEFKSLTRELLRDIINYFYNTNIQDCVLDNIKFENLTTATLINSIILPNINNYKYVIDQLSIK